MLSPYRRIFAVPGAKLFCAYGLVGRLPISMVTLGIVLGVTLRHGSYTLAGSVSAAFVVAEAVGAVVHGRLVDRLGQARWLPVSGLAFAAAGGCLHPGPVGARALRAGAAAHRLLAGVGDR